MDSITLLQPDDWHAHLRDGSALKRTVPDLAKQFARAICMPNLVPPVKTVEEALAYRERILAHVPEGLNFDPRMVLYFTDFTSPDEVRKIKESGHVNAIKLYPAGATTNSEWRYDCSGRVRELSAGVAGLRAAPTPSRRLRQSAVAARSP